MTTVDVPCRGPFDLDLSLRAMRSFRQTAAATGRVFVLDRSKLVASTLH